MAKNVFIEKYQLSDAVPMDPTTKAIPTEAFAEAIDEFISDHFRGIARVNTDRMLANPLLISTEYTAYFFKMLLTYVYGRVFIDIDLKCDENGLNIFISSNEELPLTEKELRFLIKTARNAGMEIYPSKSRIDLNVPFSKAAFLRVYAISVGNGKRIMLSKLNEIFFCGSPITLTRVKR